jgi:hypothetical protein
MDLKAAVDQAALALLATYPVPLSADNAQAAARVTVAAAAPLIEAAARADERAKLMVDRCHLSARCPRCGCTGSDVEVSVRGFCSHCEDWPAKGIVGGRAEPSSVAPATDSSLELPRVRCLRCEHPLGECVCQDDKVLRGVR